MLYKAIRRHGQFYELRLVDCDSHNETILVFASTRANCVAIPNNLISTHLTEDFAYVRVVQVWVRLQYLSSLFPRPHHKGVHWALDVAWRHRSRRTAVAAATVATSRSTSRWWWRHSWTGLVASVTRKPRSRSWTIYETEQDSLDVKTPYNNSPNGVETNYIWTVSWILRSGLEFKSR